MSAITLQPSATNSAETELTPTRWEEAPIGKDLDNRKKFEELEDWMEKNSSLTPRFWYRRGLKNKELEPNNDSGIEADVSDCDAELRGL